LFWEYRNDTGRIERFLLRKDFPIFVIELNINTMHELSIAIHIADIIENEAIQAQAEKVTKVELEIGSMSGVEPAALELAVPEAFRGTMMEKAELVYHYIPASAVCQSCCHEFDPTWHFSICPHCNSSDTYFLRGKELNIKSFDIIKS